TPRRYRPCLTPIGRRARALRLRDGGGLLAMRELFDVHVASRHHLDARHEPRGTEHVPDPGVAQIDADPTAVEVGDVDRVRQVEASLGLDHEREHREHVAILPVELELAFLFEAFDVVVAHRVHQLLTRTPSPLCPTPAGSPARRTRRRTDARASAPADPGPRGDPASRTHGCDRSRTPGTAGAGDP